MSANDNDPTGEWVVSPSEVTKINAERKRLLTVLQGYVDGLCSFQSKIFEKFHQLNMDNDGFYDFTRYTEHLGLSQFFSNNTSDINLQNLCIEWDQLFAKVIRLKVRYHPYFVPLPKILAACCIIEGQYSRALCLLHNAVQLRLIDMSSWFTLLWWVIYLQDWQVLGFLLQRERQVMQNAARGDGYGLFVECCTLVYKLHIKPYPAVANEIVKKLRDIHENDKRTFMYSHCKILLRKALMYASRIECISLSEIGDPIYNCSSALESCDLILHSRLPQFAKQETPVSESLQKKLPQNDDFTYADELLRIFSTVADYFELSQECSNEMLEVGLVRESDSYCQTSWKHAILFGVPYRAISSLTQVIYIRTVTLVERELLGKYGACLNALITPSNSVLSQEDSNVTEKKTKASRSTSRRRVNTEQNDYSLIIEEVTSSIKACNIDNKGQSHGGHRSHNRPCKCTICAMINISDRPSNWRMNLQVSWISLIFSGYEPAKFEEFRKKCQNIRQIVLNERKTLCRQMKAPDLKEFVTPEFLELWIQACTCVLVNKSALVQPLPDSLRDTYLDEMLSLCNYAPLKFRAYSLLLNLLKNENSYYGSQSSEELEQSDSPTLPPTSSSIMAKPAENSNSIEKEIHEAYMDQKRFGHLFFRQWRSRNCLFLGRNLRLLSHKALFLLEVGTPAVRQCARMCHHERQRIPLVEEKSAKEKPAEESAEFVDNLNFYFKDTAQFSKFISSLPKDTILVNLVIDSKGTLWLIRCHSTHDPIVIPVSNVFEYILDKNNESLSAKLDATTFWRTRRQLDSDIKELLYEWQESWFGGFAPLLTALAHEFTASELSNIRKIENKLASQFKISTVFAITLTRLCSHISKKSWQALVKRLLANEPNCTTASGILSYYSILHSAVSCVPNSKMYTLLVVPPQLNFLPWECLPIFEKAPLVSRLPSVHFFDYLMNKIKVIPKPVDGRKSYYVLNPGGDLENTEKRISVFVEKYRWNGVMGKIPSKTEIKNALATHDLFLYVGHGSGGRYFGRTCIRQSDCKAVSVLMGCSSGCIQDLGPTFDGKGSIYEYLIARCPCLIGCLWTVTDGEIDRFFMALVEYCFGKSISNDSNSTVSISDEKAESSAGTPLLPAGISPTHTSRFRRKRRSNNTSPSGKENVKPSPSKKLNNYRLLVEGVTEARKICKLPFLTGASVVTYGLPIIPRFSSDEVNNPNSPSHPVILIDE